MSRPRRPSAFRIALAFLYVAGFTAFGLFLADGWSYYATPLIERPRHDDYWTLKPGGSRGLLFGVAGTAMMTCMHLYSVRKRVRWLRRLGPLARWLDVHILLGVMGPLFIVLHSSFKVGGLVAVSFWSMVAVAVSGVFGRYLYLQVPRTRAGEALSLAEAEEAERRLALRLQEQFGIDAAQLARLDEGSEGGRSLLGRLGAMLVADLTGARGRRLRAWAREGAAVPRELTRELLDVARRRAALRWRIARWDDLHALFHHWHVVHKPFAVVMYLFVLVHVAVATMTGYGWSWAR